MAISTPAQKPRGRGQEHPVDVHVDRGYRRADRVAWSGHEPAPRVVAVAPGSPADRAGLEAGDEVLRLNGEVPRDVIQWRLLTDEAEVEVEVRRGGLELTRHGGEAGGRAARRRGVQRAVRPGAHVRQPLRVLLHLPAAAGPAASSLYLKDDDYRLSFLYGNFTTLTRFTEADLERVIDEGLSPLNVSIHATDPDVRSRMLRNRRGATSLRWLRALLDHGVTVHGQVVVCPGVNDGAVLDDTLTGVLDQYPELATLCVVPLGVSRYNREAAMRPHTAAEAAAVVDTVHDWQDGLSSPCSAAGWCSPPTSTTCWPAGRSRRPRRTRASRCTRTASAWPARSSWSSTGRRHGTGRRAERVLRLGRRRAGRGLPRPPEPGRGSTGLRGRGRASPGPGGVGRSRGAAAVAPGTGRGAHRAATAPACCDRCWRRSVATTCA